VSVGEEVVRVYLFVGTLGRFHQENLTMAICLLGEQRSECVAFRPGVDLAAGIPSRDAAADPVRASNQFPDSESPVCMMLLLNSCR
jgi:hypothetical protein